ncbi:5'-3' exoribonuclease 1-like [Mizuhopecten yessoensis]|uniref:5'-3' exoribonuclease 1-like n=1 Tax=Mizuhopecten yessoensis TaxID=6573 RepID=UPI000B45ED3C|nr:5'-3' exoribonuclease 1-like [Mizuhopecten yessoensis]
MGVPKFYRWISERYPCLSEVVKEFQIPEFDNLYLDMNGVVHTCSHPDDGNPHFRITEEKIVADIFYYLEFLFRTIKPKKVFFMAIDGVAPRAKMNQQRGRRFRSARDAEELERKARESGETLPTEKRFDSNCITPGTEFMVRLQEQLKYFVVNKISTDPLWQGVQVHLSGHETPGEGEHKIMDYIRHEKSKPNYDHNTRHCLYGLDADLMMLGLSCHEPHFSLLREEVKFGGKKDAKKPSTPEETTFHLLHLSLFREYLDFEFSVLKDKLPFGYDLERIIDDWIMMGFLVGNDFIPHLPNLHINHDALPLIWSTYINVLPRCGGYLHTGGKLHLDRFEIFMTELAKFDFEKFEETFADLKWLEGKVEKNPAKKKNHSAAMSKLIQRKQDDNQFAALVEESGVDMDEDFGDPLDGEGLQLAHLADIKPNSPSSMFEEEFRVHKRHYYMTKLEYEQFTDDVLREQAECYVRGIQWILYYYFDGVPSWSWYYPHHYAPFISDVKCFAGMDIQFERSTPFLPFQQLMAVLPSNSKDLLPKAYWNLMMMDSSEIIDFYPVNFQSDLNGKQQDWEAVVLIPFIDEKRLLTAMAKVEHLMSPSEKKRNCHSPSLCYDYVTDQLPPYPSSSPGTFPDVVHNYAYYPLTPHPHQELSQTCYITMPILCYDCVSDPLPPYPSSSPGTFPDVVHNYAKLTLIPKDEFQLPRHLIKKGMLEGTRQDVYFPGFPTFKHLPHKAYLKKEGVKVFTANSRGENMILSLVKGEEEDIKTVANSVLHNNVFVSWPHMIEVKVISVSDGNTRYELSTTKEAGQTRTRVTEEEMNKNDQIIWRKDVVAIRERYHDRLGVDVGQTHVSLRALPLVGRKYICGAHGKIVLEKQFASNPVTFLYQTSVKDLNVYDTSFCQFNTLGELFPAKEAVFMLGWPHYACQGEVVDIEDDSRVRINVSILEEPNLDNVENDQGFLGIQYYPGYVIAPRLAITSHFLSRMTGCIMVTPGSPDNPNDRFKTNIGLNLKFTKRNEEVPGYTKRTDEGWTYSDKAMEVVGQYLAEFPEIWSYISSKDGGRGDNFYETDLFKEGSPYSLKKMTDFVKGLPCNSVKTMKAGAEILDQGVINAIEQEVQKIIEVNKRKQRRVKMQVKPHLLFKPMVGQGNMVPDQSVEFYLFDRVANVRKGYPVPFGLRGTVTGVHIEEKETDTIYDIVFDEEFPGGITLRCSPGKGYRMPKAAMINLSHGVRKNEKKTGKAAANQEALTKFLNKAYQQSLNNRQQDVRPGSNNRQQDFRPGSNNNNNMSYAAASQGGRSDNRYSNQENYNDNRSYTKGEKQYQNSRAEQDNNWRAGKDSRQDFRGGANRQDSYRREGSKDNSQHSQMETQSDLHLKSFNQEGGASSPKFVTPKVSQSGKPTPGKWDGAKGQTGKAFVEPQNSDFINMWQELKSSGNHDQTSTSGTSLSVAAAALDKLPKPSVPCAEGEKPLVTLATDHKESEQPLVTLATENEGSEQPLVTLATDNEGPKLNLESLFSQASKVQQSVDNDQFSAMFKSLEISGQDSTVAEDGSIIIRSKSKSPARDADAEIKQMLNIGLVKTSLEPGPGKQEADTTAPPSAKNYGRQMSVQELFDGVMQPAKHVATAEVKQETVTGDDSHKSDPRPQGSTSSSQASTSMSNPPTGAYTSPNVSMPPGMVHPYPPPLQVPPPAMMQHQMTSQPQQQSPRYQTQSRGPPPGLQIAPQFRGHHQGNQQQKPARRNPVLELINWSKMMGLQEPKYDFGGKPGSFVCVVTLSNGHRFMGSKTRSKEEAAESAAGVMLVHLMPPQAMHPLMAPRAFGGMPAQMMQHPQFSSPNSAFKPVSPKEFIEQPRGHHAQPPNYRGNQSANQYSDNRYHQQQHQTHSHYHDSRGQHQTANQYQDNRNNNQGPNQGPYQGNTAQRQQQKFSPNQRADNKVFSDSKDASPPKSNPFVPMQVTRKTPSKRRESESRDSNGQVIDTSPRSDVSLRSDGEGSRHEPHNTARDLFGGKPQKPMSSAQEPQGVTSALNGQIPREVTPAKSPRQSHQPSKSPGQQQKRRPRMAAKFNMAQ